MKQIERDILTLHMLQYLLEAEEENINSYIPEFDIHKLRALSKKMKYFETEEALIGSMSELANNCYKRVKKKFKNI
ncbi:hypothetical protein NV379_01900 [Paenibacillus sp. N1-5-1-14]|uniref:hypothetical protein n=1 Tax=Paenibacillus radicibacter TaxID=2972488 RepID=UPI002158E7EF|nr:hypothetical protein [Paenibacillus radicibacter]MCR8641398.1 hypothetical protein [Paenibacillus radicibacter]